MTDIPLITLWEFTPPKGNVVRITSSPPVRIEQTPFPQRGIWIGGNPWYCAGVDVTGVEHTSGIVLTATLNIKLNEYIIARKNRLFVPGCVVKRFQTDGLAADGANWSTGINPFGTPRQTNHKIDKWVVIKINQETTETISLSMQNETEFWNDTIRPVVQGRCYHQYRGNACGYTGNSYWDVQDNSVSTRGEDVCGLRIKSCELRFPTGSLPYGGDPNE